MRGVLGSYSGNYGRPIGQVPRLAADLCIYGRSGPGVQTLHAHRRQSLGTIGRPVRVVSMLELVWSEPSDSAAREPINHRRLRSSQLKNRPSPRPAKITITTVSIGLLSTNLARSGPGWNRPGSVGETAMPGPSTAYISKSKPGRPALNAW